MYCSLEDDSGCMYLLSTFVPMKNVLFFLFADSSRKKRFLRHTGGKQNFCDRVFVFEIWQLSESCLKVWNGGNGMGRDGLPDGEKVNHDKCIMRQTAVVTEILYDYTLVHSFFFTMYYSVFWISGKFTIFNFSGIFSLP